MAWQIAEHLKFGDFLPILPLARPFFRPFWDPLPPPPPEKWLPAISPAISRPFLVLGLFPILWQASQVAKLVPQRNCVTKILPNVRGNFPVRFASKKTLFCWVMTGEPLELFRKVFGCCSCFFWFCGSFLVPEVVSIKPRQHWGRIIIYHILKEEIL